MKKDITFTLPAEAVEGANEVIILGEFNNWSPADEYKLEKQQDGSYKAIIPLEAGRTYQYRFLLDNGRWVNDYHAQYYVPVHHFYVDNCVITVDETNPDQVEEKNTPAETEQQAPETAKKEKAPKEQAGTTAEASESTSKKPATSKTAKAKPASEKVKTKKAEKPEKAPKASKKESPKK